MSGMEMINMTRDVQLISPSRQREWGGLAAANFILGGVGTGFYFINWAAIFFNRPFSEKYVSVPYDLFSLVIVAIGFLCVAIEAGRPSRAYYMFGRFGKSWISREATAFTVFLFAVVLSHFIRHWIFDVIAAVSAACFMIIQGFIVYSARAVVPWNTVFIPITFLSSGLVSGAGTVLIFTLWDESLPLSALAYLALICVVFNLAIWLLYLRRYGTVFLRFITGSQELKSRFSRMQVAIAFSHIAPILMLFVVLKMQVQNEVGEIIRLVLVGSSGLIILIAVIAQKTNILLSTGYMQGVSFEFNDLKTDE
jgi:DMSO reductase anchor subunit